MCVSVPMYLCIFLMHLIHTHTHTQMPTHACVNLYSVNFENKFIVRIIAAVDFVA